MGGNDDWDGSFPGRVLTDTLEPIPGNGFGSPSPVAGVGLTGEPTYFVVANAETQHVASLVARQKKLSLKKL